MDLVRLYLKEIGQIPMLTHDQEITYGKQVQQMMRLLAAKESLTEKLGREPTQHSFCNSRSAILFRANSSYTHGTKS